MGKDVHPCGAALSHCQRTLCTGLPKTSHLFLYGMEQWESTAKCKCEKIHHGSHILLFGKFKKACLEVLGEVKYRLCSGCKDVMQQHVLCFWHREVSVVLGHAAVWCVLQELCYTASQRLRFVPVFFNASCVQVCYFTFSCDLGIVSLNALCTKRQKGRGCKACLSNGS